MPSLQCFFEGQIDSTAFILYPYHTFILSICFLMRKSLIFLFILFFWGEYLTCAHFCGGLCAEFNHKVVHPNCFIGESIGMNDQELCCQICVQWPSCRAWTFERQYLQSGKLLANKCSYFNCIEMFEPAVQGQKTIVSGVHWGALDPISDSLSIAPKKCGNCTKNWGYFIDEDSHLALIGGVYDAETCCGICTAFPNCNGYSWTVPSTGNTWQTGDAKFQSWLPNDPAPPSYPHCYLEAATELQKANDEGFDQVAGVFKVVAVFIVIVI